MPSSLDLGFIVLLALLLFGPKKLPVLARQFGRLMADFRRASNEFRTQMEEELRISEQADRQKEIAALQAAAPPSPAIDTTAADTPHLPPPAPAFASPDEPSSGYDEQPLIDSPTESAPAPEPAAAPLPIATSGDLSIMPPATGLPVPNSTEAAIPEATELECTPPAHHAELETETLHG